ncbi:MAG: hypothetical protein DMG61_02790, partial [Acidobacteria bacterium]
GISISGTDAGNYTFNTTASASADITPRALLVSAIANNKTYDTLTTASVTLSDNHLAGDVVTDNFAAANFSDKNVGIGKTITVMGIFLSGADAGNYSPNSTASTTANITPAALTVTATGINRTYNTTNVATVTLSDNHLGSDAVTDIFTTAFFTDKNVGTGKLVSVNGISISGTDAGNYSLQNTTATTTANIGAATLTVSAAATDKVYDTTTAASVVLSDNHLGSDSVTESFAAANFATKSAGNGKTVTVTGILISGSDAGNYVANGTATTTANITPAALTVTAAGINKVYDATIAATVNLSDNRLGSDSVTDTVGSAVFATKTVGNGKTISVTGISISGTDAGNYSLQNTTATATANISAASLTVTAAAADKVYDGTNVAGVTLSDNHIGGDTVTDSFTSSTFPDKNAGAGRVVSVAGISISGSDAGNYILTNTTATSSANIAQRPLTVTAVANTKTYDGTTTAVASPSLTGSLASGDTGTFSESYSSKTAGNAKTLVAAVVINDGNSGNNYALTRVDANSGVINPLNITGSISTNSKVYDASTIAVATCTPVGVIPPDSVACALTGATFDTKNVGTGKTVTATGLILSGTDSANYTITSTATSMTAGITPAHLTVTADPQTRVYGGTNPGLTATISSFVVGENLVNSGVTGQASCTTPAGTTSTVAGGPYTITCTNGTLAAGNYDFPGGNFVTGNLTLTKAPLTVAANDKTRTYGSVNPTLDGTLVGVVAGDNITDSFSTTALATTPIGGVPITAALNDPAGRLPNYSVTNNSGTLTITRAHLTVMAVNQARLYGGANPTTSVNLTGFQNGENQISANVTGSATVTDATTPTTGVGTYPITVTDAGNLSAPNYDFLMSNFVNGNLTITQAHLAVTADAQTRVYGAANPTLTATISGFANGETLATSGVTGIAHCTTPAGATSTVGNPYTITCTQNTLAAGNYDFPAGNFSTSVLTLTQAPLMITANSSAKIYGQTPVFVGNEFTTVGLLNADTVTSVGLASSGTSALAPVGSYNIVANSPSGSGLSNYAISFSPGTLVVGKATPSVAIFAGQNNVTGTTATFTFNANAKSLTAAVTGVPGETASLTISSITYTGSTQAPTNAGSYPVVATFNGNNNYVSASASGTLVVAPARSRSSVIIPSNVGTGNAAKFTFVATVVSLSGGGTPGGTVTFMDNGAPLAAGDGGQSSKMNIDANGRASFTTSASQLAAGQVHSITAVYNREDPNFTDTTAQVAAGVTIGATLTVSPGAAIAPQVLALSIPSGTSFSSPKCSIVSDFGAIVANTSCGATLNGSSLTMQLATNSFGASQPAPSQAMLRMRMLNPFGMVLPAVFF